MDIKQWLQRTIAAHDEDVAELQQGENFAIIRHRTTHEQTPHVSASAAMESVDARPKETKNGKRKHKRKSSTSAYSRSAGTASTAPDAVSQCTSSSSSSSAPSEHFERRKRHKTRENLYEPHSGVRKRRSKRKGKDEDKEKKGKRKHQRTKKKTKEAKKPGLNLINNFSAENVRHDRLTVSCHQ